MVTRRWGRRVLALALGSWLGSGLGAGWALAATDLPEAIAAALAWRPDLKRQDALTEAARAAVEEALAGYLPRIDASLATGWQYADTPTTRADGGGGANQWTKSGALAVNQLLFDGFRTDFRVERATAEAAAAAGEGAALAELVAIDTVEAYLDVQRNQAFVALAADNLEAHRRLLGQVRAQASAGQVTDADVAQARARAAFAEATLAERLGGLAQAVAAYVERVGGAPDELLEQDVPAGQRPTDEGAALAIGLAQNPSLAIGRAALAGSAAEVGIAQSRYWPQADLVGRAQGLDDSDGLAGWGTQVELGAEVGWNLYAGGGDRAAVARAEAELRASGHDLAERERQVREAVAVAYRQLLSAEAVLPALRDHAAAARQVLGGYRQQFDIGRRSLLDLLDAQGELFTAELRATDARYRLVLAHYRLLYAMGGLTRAVGIAGPR